MRRLDCAKLRKHSATSAPLFKRGKMPANSFTNVCMEWRRPMLGARRP